MTRLPEAMPLSALEHYEYCPRQAALIHVDGLWQDNRHTVRGQAGHRRADHAPDRQERGRRVLRGVPVWSHQYDLTGRCDIVEMWPDGSIVPVEYKIGVRHGRAAELQLAAQAMCLEEMTDRPIPIGFVWFARYQRRQRVAINDELRTRTIEVVRALRVAIDTGNLPEAVNDERCGQCQLLESCLPQVLGQQRRFGAYLRRRFE